IFNASWMVASDVATTCTSRIAMNMPMHIMAKPIQTLAVTASVALFSVTEIIAGPVEDSCGRPLDISPSSSPQTNLGRDADGIRSIACPILGQSYWCQPDIPRNSGDLTAISTVACDGKTHLCLIFVTLKQDYDRPLWGRARWNCWAKVFSSVYW